MSISNTNTFPIYIQIIDKVNEVEGFFDAIELIDNDSLSGVDYSLARDYLERAIKKNYREVKELANLAHKEGRKAANKSKGNGDA